MPERTLGLLFRNAADHLGTKTAFGFKSNSSWNTFSYADARRRVEAIGMGLIASGVGPGDRVAIHSPNRLEWYLCDLAIVSIGSISVPIHALVASDTLKYIVSHSGSKVLFCAGSGYLENIEKLRSELSHLEMVVCFDPVSRNSSSHVISLMELEQRGEKTSPEDFEKRLQQSRSEDVSSIVYTSGTTGVPKGVMLTHGNIYSNFESAVSLYPLDKNDTALSVLPLSHVYERTVGFYALIHLGGSIYIAEDVSKLASNIVEVKPTILFAVPRLLEKFYARVEEKMAAKPLIIRRMYRWGLSYTIRRLRAGKPRRGILVWILDSVFFRKIRDGFGGRLRVLGCGGAILPKHISEFLIAAGLPLAEAYGLTETAPLVSGDLYGKKKVGTVGKPYPNIEVKIAEDGEILIRGPNVMKGYYLDEEGTASAIDKEGWFHSGDIGVLDPEGFLKITDRKKDLLVTSGGKKIAPQPMENELVGHPLIEQVCIVGDGRHFVSALIVPNFDLLEVRMKRAGLSSANRKELFAHPEVRHWYKRIIDEFNRRHARYETIKKFELMDEYWTIAGGELTPTLKLKRKVIQNKYAATIDNLYK